MNRKIWPFQELDEHVRSFPPLVGDHRLALIRGVAIAFAKSKIAKLFRAQNDDLKARANRNNLARAILFLNL